MSAPNEALGRPDRATGDGRFSARLRRVAGSTWLLGAIVGLLSWSPDFPLVPVPGFDPSWQLGLNVAASEGRNFGSEIVFTFGPLGFLDFPQLVDPELAWLALLYDLVLWFALGVSLVAAARRSFPLPVAVAVALLVGLLVHHAVIFLALLWALRALAGDEEASPPLRRLLPWVAGFVSAVVALGKLNVGFLVFALSAVAVLLTEPERRARNGLAFSATFVLSFLALWLIAAQNLGDLPDFIGYGYELVSGYSLTQGLETVDDPWRYQLAALGLYAIAFAAAWWAGRETDPARRVALIVVVAIGAFCTWKFAFLRHELIRSVDVVLVPLAALLAFRWQGRARLACLAGLAAVTVAYFPLTGLSAGDVFRPLGNAEDAFEQARSVIDPDRRERELDMAREQMQAFYGLDADTRELIGDRRVHVYPFETSMVWAYDLNWDPLPVFQSNAAWTDALDRLNAGHVSSADGPEVILFHPPALSRGTGADYFTALTPDQAEQLELANNVSVGVHYLSYDQPRTTVAMLCNFAPMSTSLQFAVLERIANRCGEPRMIDQFDLDSGESFPIPQPPGPDDVIFADVEGLEPGGLERLGTQLFRTAPRHVTFDAGEESEREYLLAPAITDSLLLSAPDAVDYPAPYRLAPRAGTVAFSEESGLLDSPGEVTVTLWAMPVDLL